LPATWFARVSKALLVIPAKPDCLECLDLKVNRDIPVEKGVLEMPVSRVCRARKEIADAMVSRARVGLRACPGKRVTRVCWGCREKTVFQDWADRKENLANEALPVILRPSHSGKRVRKAIPVYLV